MHRYDELEKKYYKRLYLKIFFYFLVIISIIIIIVFNVNHSKGKIFQEKNSSLREISKEKNISIKKVKTIAKKEHKDKNISKKINKNITEKLKFILPDIKNIKIANNEKKESNASNNHKTKKLKTEKKENETNKTVIKKTSFSLQEVSLNNQDVKLLIKNFNQNPDYDLAITIAKYYLNHNNLKKAQIWALKANNLNPEKPESWLIFANILQKENKIQKAIEILKVYKDSYGINKKIEKKLRSLYAK